MILAMKSFDMPECVVNALVNAIHSEQFADADYHMANAGRNLAFVRMAADALEKLGNEQRVAEYHAYIGTSAARTAIDATASWLRHELGLKVSGPSQVDLKRTDYRKKVIVVVPETKPFVDALGQRAKMIDEHRQRAQHREGLALIFHLPSEKLHHPGGWYLAPKGISSPPTDNVRLPDMLTDWADMIEKELCATVVILAKQKKS